MSDRINNHSNIFMFLLGLGSATKVYVGGILALSELFAFIAAPFLFLKHYKEYKRSGALTILWLSLAMIVGCLISCIYNRVFWLWIVKVSMQFYGIFAMIVVFHNVLQTRMRGIGCFFFGALISTIIAIFALNPQLLSDEHSTELIGQVDIETQMEGVLFWYPKISQILRLPMQGWYYNIPIIYSILSPIASAVTAALVSVSGRSSAAMSLLTCALVIYCRKSRARMKSIGKHFILFVIAGIATAICIKNIYVYTASAGLLGDEAQRKYYNQTHGNNSFLRVLIGGRTEFFIAIRAMIDNPIIGIGHRAEDTKGYVRQFLAEYGDQEDYEAYLRRLMLYPGEAELIPQHSTLTQFWGNAGICGLAFCLYYIVYTLFRKHLSAIPQWFGYFALAIPSSIFSLFFNPYSERVSFPLLITCLLLARAVGEGRLQLPYDMEMEARKYD